MVLKDLRYMKINLPFLLLVSIFLGFVLRFWGLGNNPPSLTPDEAALGYNSYSILKTGRDEYGNILPIIFKSFGDYKPGLYVYATIPFVAVLGLNELSVRMVSAIVGVLVIYLIFLLVKKTFPQNNNLAILTSFIAATNPWLIYFSRGAWEANLSLFLTLVGVYFFLKSFEKKSLLIWSFIAFALTTISYQGAKLSTLIVLISLVFVYWKVFKSSFIGIDKRILLKSSVVGLVIIMPVILSFFRGQTSRLEVFSIFSYPRSEISLGTFLNQTGEQLNSFTYLIFHSETLNFARAIVGRWFNVFSGGFLFFIGDWENPVHTAPYQGVLLLIDILLLPLGVLFMLRYKLEKIKLFWLLWLLLAPLSAALTRDSVSAVRSLNTAVPLVIIISFGLYKIAQVLFMRFSKTFVIIIFSLLYFISLIYFIDATFVHLPKHNSKAWKYGYKEAFEEIKSIENKYNLIVFEQSFNQPHIYYLFYNSYDPRYFQKEAKLVDGEFKLDVGHIEKVGNINFRKIDWQVLRNQPGVLVVVNPTSLPPDFQKNGKIIKEIKYLDNLETVFYFLETY